MNYLIKLSVLLLYQFFSVNAIQLLEQSSVLQSWETLTSYSQAREWPNLSRNRAIGIRTQRDVSENSTLEYTIAPGLDLNTVVFDSYGYNSDSLDKFRTLMNVGVQSFVIHLYYDEINQNWLMCPKDKILEQMNSKNYTECDVSTFNLTSIVSTLNAFLTDTNNDLDINLMFLLLELNSINFNTNQTIPPNLTDSGIQSLGSIFNSIEKVVSPLNVDNNALPTLRTLLFKLSQRVFPVVIDNNLSPNTSYNLSDDKYTFFTSLDSNTDASVTFNVLDMEIKKEDDVECQTFQISFDNSSLHFAYDTDDDPFTLQSYWESIKCGYSPIINHSFNNLSEITQFLEVSLWSWAPYQPTQTGINELSISDIFNNLTNRGIPYYVSYLESIRNYTTVFMEDSANNSSDNDNGDGDDGDEYSNRCAVLSKIGWIATSCDEKFYAVCVNSKNSSDFVITNDKKSYSKSIIECKSIDGDYELTVPANTLQQYYMISLIPSGEDVLWINLNSLSSENCWVVGIDSTCPYQAVVSHHIFVQMITPSSVMGFLLFILFLVMQFQQLPVHRNRKYWRKLLNEKLKNDYDGVPS